MSISWSSPYPSSVHRRGHERNKMAKLAMEDVESLMRMLVEGNFNASEALVRDVELRMQAMLDARLEDHINFKIDHGDIYVSYDMHPHDRLSIGFSWRLEKVFVDAINGNVEPVRLLEDEDLGPAFPAEATRDDEYEPHPWEAMSIDDVPF